MNITLLVILIIVNTPIYLLVGSYIFGNWDGFFDAVKFWFKPDLWSFMQGEWGEDFAAELKLGIFFLICAGAVFGEYWLLNTYVF